MLKLCYNYNVRKNNILKNASYGEFKETSNILSFYFILILFIIFLSEFS